MTLQPPAARGGTVIGRSLAQFRVLASLAPGGMGEVYRAWDTSLERDVALKRLPPGVASDSEQLHRLEAEARVLASLHHPCIVTVHAVVQVENERFIVMELVHGRTLAKAIPAEGFDLGSFMMLAIPLADAICAAHEAGVVHRDLKPSNVMITDDNHVKVLDFGLARSLRRPGTEGASQESTEPWPATGQISGTLPYMAPEQLHGRAVDKRSDIFSLGVICYEMLSGRRPFRGDSASAVIASVLRDRPMELRLLRPDLPERLPELIARCLDKVPDRRLQTSRDLVNELESIRSAPARRSLKPSVAVLPFTDMSQGQDQDWFCRGLADEIINTLSKIPSLDVVCRTSSFRFANSQLDSREIGRRLGASALLEGGVRKAADRLRISVELIDVDDGYTLWSERYDRDPSDIFAIQDDIAGSVAEALELTLSGAERLALVLPPTKRVEAYELDLKGREHFLLYSRRSIQVALQLYQQAIELDPSYASAYAGISACCSFLYMYGGSEEAKKEQARSACVRALELDPLLPEAHVACGLARTLERDYARAEQAFERALELEPELFDAEYLYARTCFAGGKLEAAEAHYRRAIELRPEDHQAPLLLAQVLEMLGQPEQAEEWRRRGVGLVEERLRCQPDDARALYLGANGLIHLGERDRGLAWAERALAIEPDEPMLLYNVACIQSQAGELDSAIDTLERAVASGLTQKDWLRQDSDLDPLRSHRRFESLMKRLG